MDSYQLLRRPIASIKIDDSACDVNDLAKCGGIQVSVPGGDSWAALVERAVASEWVGIEALGGFDGTVAEAVRHNYAAFGQAVADTLMSVRTWQLSADTQRTFAAADAQLGEGTSILDSADYEILDVDFLFVQGTLTRPITDGGLAALLGIELGARVPLSEVAEAVTAHMGALVNRL